MNPDRPSRTAQHNALFRAIEQRLPQPLFADPWARRFLRVSERGSDDQKGEDGVSHWSVYARQWKRVTTKAMSSLNSSVVISCELHCTMLCPANFTMLFSL